MMKDAMSGAMKEILAGVAWAAAIIAVGLVAVSARKSGYIDGEVVQRLVSGMTGLWIVWYGNQMPKAVVPITCVNQAKRFAGWAMVLSGLAYTGVWAFAPIPLAITAGAGAVLAGMAATLVYCLWLRAKAKGAA